VLRLTVHRADGTTKRGRGRGRGGGSSRGRGAAHATLAPSGGILLATTTAARGGPGSRGGGGPGSRGGHVGPRKQRITKAAKAAMDGEKAERERQALGMAPVMGTAMVYQVNG
jgi:hypothetical protein